MHDKGCASQYFDMDVMPPMCSCYKAKRVSFCFDLPVDHEGLVDEKWRGMESIE